MEHISTNQLDLNNFLHILGSSAWGTTACTKTIDDLFQFASHLGEDSIQELTKMYPGVNFNKAVDLLLEKIIINHHVNENLTLYAIKKYVSVYTEENLHTLLDKITSEVELRQCLFELIKDCPSVGVDFCKINNLLHNLDGSNCDSEIINAVKFDAPVLLDALFHCSDFQGPILIKKLIGCLECQTDLKLWFVLLRKETAQTVVKLCARYGDFLNGVFVFFDKFAAEIESTYDEDLNVKYSHVNLDFEDFVEVFQLFLKEEEICETVNEYLEGKMLLDKNYCFWIDLKSCIEN